MDGTVERVAIDSLKRDPAFVPPTDLVFCYLLERAARGAVPVFFGSVPLAQVKAFSDTFHPEKTRAGARVVEGIMDAWRAGKFLYCWVYERDDFFVASDDYLTLAAARRGQPDCIPCWILGRPLAPPKDLQGPIQLRDVRRSLGLEG